MNGRNKDRITEWLAEFADGLDAEMYEDLENDPKTISYKTGWNDAIRRIYNIMERQLIKIREEEE